jgi:hypothetical protein
MECARSVYLQRSAAADCSVKKDFCYAGCSNFHDIHGNLPALEAVLQEILSSDRKLEELAKARMQFALPN